VSILARRRVPFWLVYPAWILVCAALYFLLRGLPDPSQPAGRLGRSEAGKRAEAYLLAHDPLRFAGFEAVHAAHSPAGEVGPEARWVVLCDHPSGEKLLEAMVVEMRATDGQLIRIRRPTLQ
jgi:hypothetical protein